MNPNHQTKLRIKVCPSVYQSSQRVLLLSSQSTYNLLFKRLSSRWLCSMSGFSDRLPVGQLQIKLPGVSIHMPPFKQGFPSHSLTLSSQVLPCQPSPQTHVKDAPKPSTHWPPLEHLFSVALQIDTSISQLSPKISRLE